VHNSIYYINIIQCGAFGSYVQEKWSKCFAQLFALWRWTSEARNM